MSKKEKRYILVGDIHGCMDEFQELLDKVNFNGRANDVVISVGDLCDRGPRSFSVLYWFMNAKKQGYGDVVLGNHDWKLLRYLKGNKVSIHPEFQMTLDQISEFTALLPVTGTVWFNEALFHFLNSLDTVIEHKDFIAVHGAYKEQTESKKHAFNLNIRGEQTGEDDENGRPIRLEDWKQVYQGTKDIVHGHVVCGPLADGNMKGTQAPHIVTAPSGAIIYDIDGGCCFGGELIAIEYPSRKVTKVKAKKVYYGY